MKLKMNCGLNIVTVVLRSGLRTMDYVFVFYGFFSSASELKVDKVCLS